MPECPLGEYGYIEYYRLHDSVNGSSKCTEYSGYRIKKLNKGML